MNDKVSYEQFYTAAIKQLRNPKVSKGIHVIYSGFNSLLKQYYGNDVDPRAVTDHLVRTGVIEIKPVKGGVMLYLAGEGPKQVVFDPNMVSINDIPMSSKKDFNVIQQTAFTSIPKVVPPPKKQIVIPETSEKNETTIVKGGTGKDKYTYSEFFRKKKAKIASKTKAKRKKCSCRKK